MHCLHALTSTTVLAAAIVGQFSGVAAWLVEAHIAFGELSTTTLQQIGPALTGGCFSLGISLILLVLLSFMFPQNYDWNDMKHISVFDDISKDVSSTSLPIRCWCYKPHGTLLGTSISVACRLNAHWKGFLELC